MKDINLSSILEPQERNEFLSIVYHFMNTYGEENFEYGFVDNKQDDTKIFLDTLMQELCDLVEDVGINPEDTKKVTRLEEIITKMQEFDLNGASLIV